VDYAIVRTGGVQFKVSEGDRIRVPKLHSEVGESVRIEDVLALSVDGELTVGTPIVEGASVSAKIADHGRAKKIIVYKKKRRKGYQRKNGHRQGYTELSIAKITA
jgi:large subunit ribosomal protein L21